MNIVLTIAEIDNAPEEIQKLLPLSKGAQNLNAYPHLEGIRSQSYQNEVIIQTYILTVGATRVDLCIKKLTPHPPREGVAW